MSSFGTAFLQTTADAANKKFAEKTAEDTKIKDAQRQSDWKIAYDTTGQWDEPTRKAAMERYEKSLPPSLRKPSQKFNQIFGTLSKAAQAHAASQQGGQQPPQAAAGSPPSPAAGLPAGPSTPPPAQSTATLGMPPGGGAMTTQPSTPKPGTQPATPPPQAAQSQNSKPGLPTGPKTAPPQPAQQVQLPQRDEGMLDRQAQADEKRKLESEKQDQDFWLERGKKILGEDANPRDLAEYAGSKGARLPAQQKRVSDKGVARPGEDPSTGKQYEGVWDHIVEPDGSETWAKRDSKSASVRATVIASDVVDLDSAKALSEAGAESYPGEDGKDIDLKKIPAGMVLQRVHQPGRDTFYQPRNIADKVIHVGNEVIAVSPLQVQQVPQGAGTTLGEVRTGTTNTPTQVIRDNDGVPHVVGTTSQPNTPGPRRAEPSTPGGQSASQPAAAASPRSGIANPPGPRTPAPAGGGREVQGVTPGMDKDYLQTARSVQQALTQVVGDESNPNLKTVVSLAPDVLKDPKKTERVGKAIRMMLGGDDGLEGAHVSTGASIGPVSVGVGGFGSFLTQSLNMDAKIADKINDNLKTAMKDMTPEEKNLVDATIAAFEESIAMRSINKSGVSNAQVGAIQNTLPLIGANTFSVDEFATRMQNWAQQGLNGTWGVPPQYFRKGFIDKLKSVSDDMEKLRSKGQPSPKAKASLGSGPQTAKPGDLPKPPTKGAKLSVDDAARYLQAVGGDKTKAKKLASDDGWTF